jgi:mannose-6-phosphate isomerase
MFVGITNTPRDYAWGSKTALAELLGRVPSGKPEAEYWLGTHPGSPSLTSAGTLADITDLPFLLKVLAAGSPISLQVHPTTAQAEVGFARENAAGIPVDAPNRNYRDQFAKPEMVYALTPFRALCGFRPVAETRELLKPLASDARTAPLLDRLVDDSGIESVFTWLITKGDGVAELIDGLSVTANVGPVWDTVRSLSAAFPGDAGIAISLLLNNVELSPSEAIYLPAGVIHSGQSGLGIELLGPSDNVLRGGLTPKHVDVPELLAILDFAPIPVPYLVPTRPVPGVSVFSPKTADFVLIAVEGALAEFTQEINGPVIAFCTRGEFELAGGSTAVSLTRGDSFYISADEESLLLTGDGTLFLATVR